MKNIENNFPTAKTCTLAILHLSTIKHIFLLGTLFFSTVHRIYVFIEAEGGGPKPFTRLIKYGIDQ